MCVIGTKSARKISIKKYIYFVYITRNDPSFSLSMTALVFRTFDTCINNAKIHAQLSVRQSLRFILVRNRGCGCCVVGDLLKSCVPYLRRSLKMPNVFGPRLRSLSLIICSFAALVAAHTKKYKKKTNKEHDQFLTSKR